MLSILPMWLLFNRIEMLRNIGNNLINFQKLIPLNLSYLCCLCGYLVDFESLFSFKIARASMILSLAIAITNATM